MPWHYTLPLDMRLGDRARGIARVLLDELCPSSPSRACELFFFKDLVNTARVYVEACTSFTNVDTFEAIKPDLFSFLIRINGHVGLHLDNPRRLDQELRRCKTRRAGSCTSGVPNVEVRKAGSEPPGLSSVTSHESRFTRSGQRPRSTHQQNCAHHVAIDFVPSFSFIHIYPQSSTSTHRLI